MTPPATAVLSPITTLCAIWHWLSMITPLPIIVSSSAPRSMVVQAPISTRSPIITRPICDLHPVTTIVGITKAVCAYHCSGLDQAILTDLDLMVNGYVRQRREPAPILLFFYLRSNRHQSIITLSPSSTPDSITALAPIDTLLPSFAVASITALGAMFCAGCGVVSKICAMRA